MSRFSFTQPICLGCFQVRYPDRTAVRIKDPDDEMCCDCGMKTSMGVYLRVDPATVAHPSILRDE